MKCKYCGKYAGLFKTAHAECEQNAAIWQKYIRDCINYIYQNRDCLNISEVISDTMRQYNIPRYAIKPLLLEEWKKKVKEAMQDGVIDQSEVEILTSMPSALGLLPGEYTNTDSWKNIQSYGDRLVQKVFEDSVKSGDASKLKFIIDKIANLYNIDDERIKQNIISGWNTYLDNAVENGALHENAEEYLNSISDLFLFSEEDISQFRDKFVKGMIIRDLRNGIFPKHIRIEGTLPFILHKDEEYIWLFKNVEYLEEKRQRQYVGGSTGISFRVAHGVYLRSGAFKGTPVESTRSINYGYGIMAVTNKHIYWYSNQKSVKILIGKIISVVPYADGIVLQKDGVTAMPQGFKVDDPCFAYNLISNLARE